jgi:Mg2+ and Co2+ transporter CorA
MDVVFFPFSHVDETQRTTLTAFFSRFIFLPLAADLTQSPAMGPLVENDRAIPVFTSGSRLDEVASRVSAWMNWAAMHQGNETNLKSLIRNTPYLTDHLGPVPIQSEIRARMAGKIPLNSEDPPEKSDPLLFSIIARLTDAQNETIDQAMAELEKKRASLFSQLRGDTDPENPLRAGSLRRDPGAVMTRERIRAWAACAREAHLFSSQKPRVLVTTSAAVYDQISTDASRVTNALDIDAIKVHEDGCVHQGDWHKQVLTLMDTVSAGPKDAVRAQEILDGMNDACALTGGIQVQRVGGPDLETKLNLAGKGLLVCRVTLRP